MEIALLKLFHDSQLPLIEEIFTYNNQYTRFVLYKTSIFFSNNFTIQSYKITSDFRYYITKEGYQFVLVILSPTPIKFYSMSISQQLRKKLSQTMNCLIHVDNFRFARQLGSGAYGNVFLSLKNQNGRQYAVKVYSKSSSQPDFNIECLYNEINILRKFNHPNICRLYEVLQTDNCLYLVMEYVQGHNLDYLFKQKRPLDKKLRKKLIKQILQGLYQISKKNIVHRDIKPDNIMINNNQEVKILDFGLATDVNLQEYILVRCGSPGFVAPQIMQIKQFKNARMTTKSDIFSAGCLFYEMIFGKTLFGEGFPENIIYQNQACLFQIPYSSPLSDTKQLDLLRKMLIKQPTHRISSYQALNHIYFSQKRPLTQIKPQQNRLNHIGLIYSSKLFRSNYQMPLQVCSDIRMSMSIK